MVSINIEEIKLTREEERKGEREDETGITQTSPSFWTGLFSSLLMSRSKVKKLNVNISWCRLRKGLCWFSIPEQRRDDEGQRSEIC